jgi:hypothetical protein
MADNPLAKKLKLMPGQRAALIGAPEGYVAALAPLPDGVELLDHLDGAFAGMQLFVRNSAELAERLPDVRRALKPAGLLWITFPKGSSKIQTDLTRDKGWDAVGPADLKWINLVSVNDTWSAFLLRPYKPGEARQTFR